MCVCVSVPWWLYYKYIAKHKSILTTGFQYFVSVLHRSHKMHLHCLCVHVYVKHSVCVCVCVKRERFVSMNHKGLLIPCTPSAKKGLRGADSVVLFSKLATQSPRKGRSLNSI